MNNLVKKHLKNLEQYTQRQDSKSVLKYLNQDSSNFYRSTKEKGDVLEYYLQYLFENYDLKVTVVGNSGDRGVDLEVYSINDLKNPKYYIQVKNQKKPKNLDDIKYDLEKFKDKYTEDIESKFKYFSLNGFVSGTVEKINGRIQLEDFKDIEYLITGFKTDKNKHTHKYISNLLPHNQYAYKRAKLLSKKHQKIAVVQPTGTGKMYILNQFIVDFYLNSKMNERALCLAPTEIILNKIKKLCPPAKSKLEYMTYSKLSKLSKEEMKNFNFKEIYLDEFHRKGAKEWGKAIENLVKFSDKKLVVYGLTATPERSDGQNILKDFFNNVRAQEMYLVEAISRGLLLPPKYISSMYTLKKEKGNLEKVIKECNLDDNKKEELIYKLDEITVNWSSSNGVDKILKKHIESEEFYKRNKSAKFIVFCEDLKHLNEMEEEVRKWFKKTSLFKKVSSYSISSHYEEKINIEEINSFEKELRKDELKLLFSINKLNEGLHVDNISGIVLLRKTTSNIIYTQQIGRALSIGNKNKSIVFDLVNNFTNINNGLSFVEEYSKSNKKEMSKRKEIGLVDKEQVELEIVDEIKDIKDIFEEIKSQTNNNKIRIEDRIKEIEKFNLDMRDYPKRDKYRTNREQLLSDWILDQKNKFGYKNLTEEQKQRLFKINPKWNNNFDMIEKNIVEIEKFYKKYNKIPITNGKIEKEKSMALWVSRNKSNNFKNLTEEQKSRLLDINPQWDDNYDFIEERVIEIEIFYQKNNRIPNKKNNNYENALMAWYLREKRNKWARLSKDQKQRLFLISPEWNPNYIDNNYEEKLVLVEEFFKKYKEVPRLSGGNNRDGIEKVIGRWVRTQKDNNFKNLTEEQKSRLLDINPLWDKENKIKSYDSMISKIEDFYTTHNRAPTKSKNNSKEEIKLAMWVYGKKNAKYKSLTEEQIQRLVKINPKWNL